MPWQQWIIWCCLVDMLGLLDTSWAASVSVQARIVEGEIYLGESTILEVRIQGVREPVLPDLQHPDMERIGKSNGLLYRLAATPHPRLSARCVGRALDDAHLRPSQLDKVLLVGGSTRVPLVATLLEERLRQPAH